MQDKVRKIITAKYNPLNEDGKPTYVNSVGPSVEVKNFYDAIQIIPKIEKETQQRGEVDIFGTICDFTAYKIFCLQLNSHFVVESPSKNHEIVWKGKLVEGPVYYLAEKPHQPPMPGRRFHPSNNRKPDTYKQLWTLCSGITKAVSGNFGVYSPQTGEVLRRHRGNYADWPLAPK